MISAMTRPAKQQKISHDGDQTDTAVSSSDPLSPLPYHVISTIISLLPIADAYASRRLCQQWYDAWSSDQHLDFSEDNAALSHLLQDQFVSVVDRILSRLRDGGLVRRLKLRRMMIEERPVERVESWFALMNEWRVEELDFDAVTNEIPYTLTETVFRSASLTTLRLANVGVHFNEDSLVSLNSLKTLSLKYVRSDDQSLRKLISSCPCLEPLEIHHCLGLNELAITNPNLKSLEVRHYHSLPSLRIILHDAKSLTALSYAGRVWSEDIYDDNYCHFGPLKNVTSLQLDLMATPWESMTAGALLRLEGLISEMPSLDSLWLTVRGRGKSSWDRNFNIMGPKLENIYVEGLICNVVATPKLKTVDLNINKIFF